MAYFEYCAGNHEAALTLMKHSFSQAKYLYCGQLHPEVPTAYSNTAAMLQSLDNHDQAIEFYIWNLDMNRTLYGENHVFSTASQEALVQAYFLKNDFKQALNMQKSVFKAIQSRYGDQDERTQKQNALLQAITQKAVEAAKLQRQQTIAH